MRYLFSFLFLGNGLFGLIFPKKAWRFKHSFENPVEEPTKKALNKTKFFGALQLAVGLLFLWE